MDRERLAGVLAGTLTDRPRLLRLLSMNHFDMEAASRPECLADFKVSFGTSMDTVEQMVKRYVPGADGEAVRRLLYAFFPFICGIYPYTCVTGKQKAAMEKAGVDYVCTSRLMKKLCQL